jgi:hypothetical protein
MKGSNAGDTKTVDPLWSAGCRGFWDHCDRDVEKALLQFPPFKGERFLKMPSWFYEEEPPA